MKNISKTDYLNLEFKKINKLFSENKFNIVIEKTKKLIKKNPDQAALYNMLGIAYRQIGKLHMAENILLEGLKIDSKNENLLINLGANYRGMIQFNNSEKYLKEALSINPNNINAIVNYGNLKRDTNDFRYSIQLYEKAFNMNNKNKIILINLAGIYQIVGDFDKSKKILENLLKKEPNNAIAHKLLSNVKKYKENDEHQLKMISIIEAKQLNKYDEATLSFAIAKSFEDQKNYKKSFHFFKKANDIQKKIMSHYSVKNDVKLFEEIKKIFKNTDFEKFPKTEYDDKKLIFVLGLPRSGTTLVHQILAAHSKVYGAGEIVIFDQYMHNKIKDEKFTSIFKDYSDNNYKIFQQIVKSYFKSISFIKNNENIILDKHPLNFQWIGFIKILFPNSKIIHCNRNLKDTALSIYKNAFDINSIVWSNDQDDLVKYISIYLDLMAFWKKKIPNFIYDIHYEKIIENKENEIKNLINFCGLNWEDDCLNFNKKANPIKTVSITQARKPIYSSSVKLHEKYKEYLNMFKKID